MHAPRAHVVAAHEAAHVVVGCAVGLRLRKARIGLFLADGVLVDGFAWFAGRSHGAREPWAMMYAAGVAWDRAVRSPGYSHSSDAAWARELCSGRAGYLAMLRATAALLAARRHAHERVTQALLERDLTGDDVAALARGESLDLAT